MTDRFVLVWLGDTTQLLLVDGSWAPLGAFLDPTHARYGRYRGKLRVFTSKRRAQELRHDWPTWVELGIGIMPL